MPKGLHAFLVLAAALLVAACSLPQGAALRSEIVEARGGEDPGFQVVEVTRAMVPELAAWPATGRSGSGRWLPATRGPSSALIRPGDRVTLVIWDSQDNSLLTSPARRNAVLEGAEVMPSGRVFLPYAGEVDLAGATPQEARARVQDALEGIAPSVQVQLSVEQGSGNAVDIVSGVSAPGRYPLSSRDTSILSVLAAAGGIRESLQNPLVRLMREGETYEIRAESLFAEARRNTRLRGGDTIVVEEDPRHFTALGAAGTEDLIPFPEEDVSALEAVSLMGGLSDRRADPEGLLILREFAPEDVGRTPGPTQRQVILTFDLTSADGLFAARNVLVNPGDTVLATESPVTRAETIFDLVGRVFGVTRQARDVGG